MNGGVLFGSMSNVGDRRIKVPCQMFFGWRGDKSFTLIQKVCNSYLNSMSNVWAEKNLLQ